MSTGSTAEGKHSEHNELKNWLRIVGSEVFSESASELFLVAVYTVYYIYKVQIVFLSDKDTGRINCITAEKVLFKNPVCPLPEKCATLGIDPITYRNNHVQVIHFQFASYQSAFFILNNCVFRKS